MKTGFVTEIFCSVQGEGPLVGQRQVFLRTAGCSAACRWCDTMYSKVRSPRCVVHGQGAEETRTLPNPLSAVEAADETVRVARHDDLANTVSITGGEPLEQADFVADVAARLKEAGLDVYLETNGMHDVEFAQVLPYVDVVAMDVKLPSATGSVAWKRHEAFLTRIAGTPIDPGSARSNGRGMAIFVKVVVDDRSEDREIETAARLVASADPRIPFVLQPESRTMMSEKTPPDTVRRLYRLLESGLATASAFLEDVRVIPQVHKLLGVR
jgi:7-carboxy-7-deazaguanine synthase